MTASVREGLSGATGRLLIVEDEILVALEIEDAARDAGLEVIGIAADTETALRLGTQADFALVDLNLRDGLTGPEIARRLIDEHGVSVIFLTANPGLLQNENIGALGVLSKPCRPVTIIETLCYAAAGAARDGFTAPRALASLTAG